MIKATITGILLAAKTAKFTADDGQDIVYGKIQVQTPDASGDFFSIENIKVKTEKFGLLPDIQTQVGKRVTLELDQQSFKGKTSNYLAGPLAKAA